MRFDIEFKNLTKHSSLPEQANSIWVLRYPKRISLVQYPDVTSEDVREILHGIKGSIIYKQTVTITVKE